MSRPPVRIMPFTRSRRLLAGCLLAFAAVACGEITKPKATYVSLPAAFTLSAFPNAPANTYTAISFLYGPTVVNSAFTFDLTFDITSTGDVKVYPVRTVAGALAGLPKRVGLQLVSGPFEAVTEVPASGYDTLSVQTIKPGQILAVELQEFATCGYSLGGTNIYAKLTVDSVRVADRLLFARQVVDPNCGYRQVVPDEIPTN